MKNAATRGGQLIPK